MIIIERTIEQKSFLDQEFANKKNARDEKDAYFGSKIGYEPRVEIRTTTEKNAN